MGVMIGWHAPDLAIQGITLTVNSDNTTQQQSWNKEDLKLTKKTIQPYPCPTPCPTLRAIPSDQVCVQFIPVHKCHGLI